jgi:adenylate kinase
LEKARKFPAKQMRIAPNILITGTPGTGKSSLAEMLMHSVDGLKHLNISELIKERKLGDKYNEEWDTWEFDDDKVYLRLTKS